MLNVMLLVICDESNLFVREELYPIQVFKIVTDFVTRVGTLWNQVDNDMLVSKITRVAIDLIVIPLLGTQE